MTDHDQAARDVIADWIDGPDDEAFRSADLILTALADAGFRIVPVGGCVTVEQLRQMHTDLHQEAERLNAELAEAADEYALAAVKRNSLHQGVIAARARRGVVRNMLYELGNEVHIAAEPHDGSG